MREILSPIILVAPTTVGKSEVAAAISEQIPDTHHVNADKYGLYADGDYFEIGLGLKPGELDTIQNPHLYGRLGAFDPLPSPEGFADLAAEEVRTIHALGGVAVIEGCSYRYNQALLQRFGPNHCVNLTWNDRAGLPSMVLERAQYAFEAGLLAETARALDAGFEHTVPMSSMLYRPAVRILHGEITRAQGEQLIHENGLDNAFEHDEWYAATAGLIRVTHDRAAPEQTAAEIISHFSSMAKN